ncbi:acetylcholinesterase-like [Glandiceps talaboti]
MHLRALIVTIFVFRFTYAQVDNRVVLTIPQGTLRGVRNQISPDLYSHSFLKIPYAEPPLGELRFRPPNPGPSWQGIRDATKFGPACPQAGFLLYDRPQFPFPVPGPAPINYTAPSKVDEDCLSVNVFAPEQTSGTNKYPVMVFIQGGAFMLGGDFQPLYNGEVLAYNNMVVVVSFNYRLSALGFLSTLDDVSPGNYGLLDQVALLEWVRDNIEYFGGDPDMVTIFGQSAGAVSAGMHMISPKSKGLFHRVIGQSGSPLNYWAIKESPYDSLGNAQRLASSIGCPVEPSNEMVACLRTKDAMEISKYSFFGDGDEFAFLPVVDGPGGFMPQHPLVYISNGSFVDVPFMIGYNKDETSLSLLGKPGIAEGLSREAFKDLIWTRIVTLRKHEGNKNTSFQDIANSIEFQYTPWENPDDVIALRENYIRCATDRLFVEGIFEHIKYASRKLVTYMYRFDYRSVFSRYPEWAGVAHGDELTYVLGIPFKEDSNLTVNDEVMSEAMMTMWSNFAKTGNPTPEGHNIPNVIGQWEPFTDDNQELIRFSPNGSIYMADDIIDFSSNAFWNIYDVQVVESATHTYCDTEEHCSEYIP